MYLIQQLTTETNHTILKRWLRALTQCVSGITRAYFEVVDAVLAMPWTLVDAAFCNVYMDFIENLLSANAYYTAPCLHMLIHNMTYREEIPNAPRSPISLTDQELFDMFNRVHQALFSVLRVVPTAISLLVPLLNEFFPHKRQSTSEHLWFMRNLIRILDYVPEIMTDAFGMILDHLIQIDVEIQGDLEELDEDVEQNDGDDEGGDESGSDDGDDEQVSNNAQMDVDESNAEDTPVDVQARRRAVRRHVDKLDKMLLVTFEYLEHCIKQFGRPNQQALLEMLLMHFERTIMTTHKSRYTQFIVFYVSSKRSDFPEVLLSFLIHVLMDPHKTTVLRQSAVAYIAGIICRNKRVSVDSTRRCLDLLFQWAHSYMDHCEESVVGPDPSRFALFYSVCQSLFYIICFRHRQILNMQDGAMYMQGLGFDRLINSRFNPLKVCLASIVGEFARITEQYQLVYCWTIINRNKRLLQPTGLDGQQDNNPSDLESFFVFEPFRLKLTSQFINGYYQEWNDGRTIDDDEGSNSSQSQLGSEDAEDRRTGNGFGVGGVDDEDDDDDDHTKSKSRRHQARRSRLKGEDGEGGDSDGDDEDEDDDDDDDDVATSYVFDMRAPESYDNFESLRELGMQSIHGMA